MQHSGTLRKRKRRNLTKVYGLSTTDYGEDFDKSDFQPDPRSEEVIVNLPQTGIVWAEATQIVVEEFSVRTDRTHFFDKTSITRLQQTILLGMSSGALPWRWNKKDCRIERCSPHLEKLWNIQWYLVALNALILTFFHIYIFLKQASQATEYREVFMSYNAIAWYYCFVLWSINSYLYREKIRNYINTLIQFNKDNVEKFLIHLDGFQDDGGWQVMNLVIPGGTLMVFISIIMFFVMPFLPFYLISYVYPKPWYWLIPGGIHQYIIYGQVITWFNLSHWVIVAHANTANFWLHESHNTYQSDFTVDELRNYETSLKLYRSLQILCECFNECVSPMAVPISKWTGIAAVISCAYVIIRSVNHKFFDEFPAILLYPIGAGITIAGAFGFLSLSAKMFDLAAGFIDSWGKTKYTDRRRLLMSCPCLKVKVGFYYFITVSTTITFFKVIFDYLINCVITFP